MKYVSAADPEYIAFSCPAKLLFDITNTVDSIAGNPFEWNERGYGLCILVASFGLVAKPASRGT
jgi:hypothetical protein